MVSEASGPCVHEADLDFEDVYLEQDTSAISCETVPTKEKENLHQEAPAFCYSDVENPEEELPDEAAVRGQVIVSTGESQEERFTQQDPAHKGEDEEDEGEEMKSGRQLLLAYIGDKNHGSIMGDRPSVERRPLTPEGDENTPIRNQEQGGAESDEISYFQRVPERGSKTQRTEDDPQESDETRPDPGSEDLKSEEEQDAKADEDDERRDREEEGDILTLCCDQELGNPHWDDPAGDMLDSPELMEQRLQDLLADDEEAVQKMEDFSGDDHQEAGESFAEYPSDFSSCEYIEPGEGNEESNGRCAGDGTHSETLFVWNRETQQWNAELAETMSGDITAMRCEMLDFSFPGEEEPKGTEKHLDDHGRGSRDDLVDDNEEFPDVTRCPAEGVELSSGSLDDRIRAFNEFYEDSEQLTAREGTAKGEGEGHFKKSLFCAGHSFCFI